MASIISCRDVTVSRGGRPLIHNFSYNLERGCIAALIGPNGAGKSTLLAALSGVLALDRGVIKLAGRNLRALPRRQIASQLGLLPQETEDPYPTTVLETALMGRHPHIGFWRWESSHDVTLARSALSQTGLQSLATRNVSALSGGERRRLALATLLCQEPEVYLLDEPLDQLDPSYQIKVMKILERLAIQGAAILASIHDLTIAARFTHECLLIMPDGNIVSGPTPEVLTEKTLSNAFGVKIRRYTVADKIFFSADTEDG